MSPFFVAIIPAGSDVFGPVLFIAIIPAGFIGRLLCVYPLET